MTDQRTHYDNQIAKFKAKIEVLDAKIDKPEYISYFQLKAHRKNRAILRNKIKHYEKKILLLPQLDLFD